MAWVYILKCADESFYTGSTTDIYKRLSEHQAGVFSNYSSSRLPVKMVFSQEFPTLEEANCAERMIKGWTRRKKEALISSDFERLRQLAECRNETSHKYKEK